MAKPFGRGFAAFRALPRPRRVCDTALARHRPSGLPRPVPLGRGPRREYFATYTPPRNMIGLYSRCRGAANSVRHFGVRDSQKVHLPFMIRTFFHRIITAYKETISLCDFLSPYQTKQEAPPHGGASCFVPAKRVNPFCRKSFRCALRLGWPLASLRHSAPRKVFFATYTPPQKTDWIFFAPCAARTL